MSRVTLFPRAVRIGLLAAWAWAPFSHAQSPSDCPPAPVELTTQRIEAGMSTARDHGFLWRISKGGHASYLYGTIHLAKLEWMFPGPTVLDALRESDTVALEIDLLDPDVQHRLRDGMTAERGFAFPEPIVERLGRRMAAECVEPESMAKMGPELQAAALTVLAARRDGLDPSYSVDLMLSGLSRSAHKSMISLETPETHLQALQLPSRDEAIAFVTSALDDLESGRARPLLNRLAAVWAAGDHAELARYDAWCECRKTPAERQAMKRLLDDRNPGLADSIDALHSSGRNVFAAVGSLHMVGPLGLPAQMTRRGYRVELGEFER
ncbi:MAG TPA: TraB/GumN family protein [Caldimonas sp.]